MYSTGAAAKENDAALANAVLAPSSAHKRNLSVASPARYLSEQEEWEKMREDEDVQRAGLVNKVIENETSITAWRDLLTYERSKLGDRPDEHDVRRVIRLYERATRNLPRENYKRASSISKETYVRVWLELAKLQGIVAPEEARETYDYLDSHHIGQTSAAFWCARAQFEVTQGNKGKAIKIISKGLRAGAEPAKLLEDTLRTLEGKAPKPSAAPAARRDGANGGESDTMAKPPTTRSEPNRPGSSSVHSDHVATSVSDPAGRRAEKPNAAARPPRPVGMSLRQQTPSKPLPVDEEGDTMSIKDIKKSIAEMPTMEELMRRRRAEAKSAPQSTPRAVTFAKSSSSSATKSGTRSLRSLGLRPARRVVRNDDDTDEDGEDEETDGTEQGRTTSHASAITTAGTEEKPSLARPVSAHVHFERTTTVSRPRRTLSPSSGATVSRSAASSRAHPSDATLSAHSAVISTSTTTKSTPRPGSDMGHTETGSQESAKEGLCISPGAAARAAAELLGADDPTILFRSPPAVRPSSRHGLTSVLDDDHNASDEQQDAQSARSATKPATEAARTETGGASALSWRSGKPSLSTPKTAAAPPSERDEIRAWSEKYARSARKDAARESRERRRAAADEEAARANEERARREREEREQRERDQREREQREREQRERAERERRERSHAASAQASGPSLPHATVPLFGQDATVYVNGRPYIKLEVIGKGGSSKVYKVMGPDRRIYAMKRVKLKESDSETVQSYINEINLLRKLQGFDYIVRLYDSEVNRERGYIHMIMEHGEIDLYRLLEKQRGRGMTDSFLRLYWQQMLEAVHTIHEARIVHADLKPANFLIVQGTLKLIDFGIAKAIQNDTTNIVRENQMGTLNYMSPEALVVLSDTQRVKQGRPSDVWSLGCILYQMVYGCTPFQKLGIMAKLQAIPDPKYKIDFPPTNMRFAEDCIRMCLQRDPAERATIPQLLEHPFLKGDSASGSGDDSSSASGASEGQNGALSKEQIQLVLQQFRVLSHQQKDNPAELSEAIYRSLLEVHRNPPTAESVSMTSSGTR